MCNSPARVTPTVDGHRVTGPSIDAVDSAIVLVGHLSCSPRRPIQRPRRSTQHGAILWTRHTVRDVAADAARSRGSHTYHHLAAGRQGLRQRRRDAVGCATLRLRTHRQPPPTLNYGVAVTDENTPVVSGARHDVDPTAPADDRADVRVTRAPPSSTPTAPSVQRPHGFNGTTTFRTMRRRLNPSAVAWSPHRRRRQRTALLYVATHSSPRGLAATLPCSSRPLFGHVHVLLGAPFVSRAYSVAPLFDNSPRRDAIAVPCATTAGSCTRAESYGTVPNLRLVAPPPRRPRPGLRRRQRDVPGSRPLDTHPEPRLGHG